MDTQEKPSLVILETKRLILRRFRLTDIDDVASYSYREEYWRYLTIPPQTRELAAEFVAKRAADEQPNSDGNWIFAAEHRTDGRVIGSCRIGEDRRYPDAADLGFGVNPDYSSQGLATEFGFALLAFGFGALKRHRIWATADVNNKASCRVLEKLNLKQEGILREHLLVRGGRRSSILYSILAHEFTK